MGGTLAKGPGGPSPTDPAGGTCNRRAPPRGEAARRKGGAGEHPRHTRRAQPTEAPQRPSVDPAKLDRISGGRGGGRRSSAMPSVRLKGAASLAQRARGADPRGLVGTNKSQAPAPILPKGLRAGLAQSRAPHLCGGLLGLPRAISRSPHTIHTPSTRQRQRAEAAAAAEPDPKGPAEPQPRTITTPTTHYTHTINEGTTTPTTTHNAAAAAGRGSSRRGAGPEGAGGASTLSHKKRRPQRPPFLHTLLTLL
jgi:hypothetical protein